MLRKWQYIEMALTNLNAPKEIIAAAHMVDGALCELGLDYYTPDWKEYAVSHSPFDEAAGSLLDHVVISANFCPACTTEEGHTIECSECKLSKGEMGPCTPRHRYRGDPYGKVSSYLQDRQRKEEEEMKSQ